MRRRRVQVCRIMLYLAGFIILVFSTFWLPWHVGETARLNPPLSYLQYSLLLCIYLTLFPFLYTLYHVDRLLDCAEKEKPSLGCLSRSLQRIGWAQLLVALIYLGAWLLLLSTGLPVPWAIHGSVVHPMFGAMMLSAIIALVRRKLKKRMVEEGPVRLKRDA